jgi:hypothetical protein
LEQAASGDRAGPGIDIERFGHEADMVVVGLERAGAAAAFEDAATGG